MARVCAGCRQEIKHRRFLKCSLCHEHYDLECANVPEERFFNTMTIEYRNLWKCDLCRSKQPKADNTNTPIRPPIHFDIRNDDQPKISQSPEINPNVTTRKKTQRFNETDSPLSDNDSFSPEGNTLILETPNNRIKNEAKICCNLDSEQISLEKFTSIIQENNEYILSSIQTSIRNEIKNALYKIEADFKKSLEKMSSDQTQLKQDLNTLNAKINTLDQSYRTLQTENEILRQKIQNLQDLHKPTNEPNDKRDKTLVLHGLTENYWETEDEVIGRVVTIFYDLLNINLTNYIEDIQFIGRKGSKRPLKIELISKRMKKYILDNSYYLKEAGFSATEYLSQIALQERRKLNEALQIARRNGHHAIIKNNKLIINGKEASHLQHSEETKSLQQLSTSPKPPPVQSPSTHHETNETNIRKEQNNKFYKNNKPKNYNFRK